MKKKLGVQRTMMKCTEDHFIMNESWNSGTSINFSVLFLNC